MKITIDLEDVHGGGVKVVSTPSFETMAKAINSGESADGAMGYALLCINAIRKASKQADLEKRGITVEIPKVLKS
jgi:hypothetical protein